MKKQILQNGVRLLAIMIIAFFISSYCGGEAGLNHTRLIQEKNTGKKMESQDLEIVRKRIIDDLLKPAINENKIKQLVESIRSDGSWPGINYKDTTKTGFQHSIHLENMLELARAYKKPGTSFYRDANVMKTVSSALDFWIAHDFICENWWWNEMGTPDWIINTLLILDTDLTGKQRLEGARIASRASLTGVGARAGGDFVPIAGMVCKQGLFKRDEAILENAIKVMADQIKITTGRGIKPDLSFNHRVDNVISIHTYGTNYVSAFAYWAVNTAGTKFALPGSAVKLLIDYYLDGICKAMAYGIYPDPGAENRDLSRKGNLHPAGVGIPQNLTLASDYRKKELENIIKIRKGEKEPNLTWSRFFWNSEYYTHQRKNYFASVRMHSSRQNNVEEPYNEEGLKNHHLADGSNFISRTGKEYVDIFPVWDWQKIPGTTVVQRPVLPPSNQIVKKGLSEFVGGVTDGEFGAAAFDFKSPHDPLTARKSWFFFDREYVCLGAGISSEADYPVVTTLNQCLLNKDVVVKINNNKLSLIKGTHQLKNVSWIFHDSVAYLFPAPTAIGLTNTLATGNWRQITHQAWATTDLVQKNVFSLWIDHGMKPRNTSYEYIVIPGIAATSVDSYSKSSGINILSNTPEIQAVHHKGLNITEAVFYKAGAIKISEGVTITVESPCMIMVKNNGKNIEEIAVSDPSRKLKSLQVSLNTPIEAKGSQWQSVWNKEKKISIIKIDLPTEGYAGESVILKLAEKINNK